MMNRRRGEVQCGCYGVSNQDWRQKKNSIDEEKRKYNLLIKRLKNK